MSIRNVHRQSMEAEVIPRFEKATREMFRQISETFTQGTQDYMKRYVKSILGGCLKTQDRLME